MKTSELIGAQLDWAVAKCEDMLDDPAMGVRVGYGDVSFVTSTGREYYRPSEDWAQGGTIIYRKGIATLTTHDGWQAIIDLGEGDCMVQYGYGPDQLVAGMRCYVASELGNEIEIPEELK